MNPPRLAASRSRPATARPSKRRPRAVLLAGVLGALLLVGVIAWWRDRPISQAEAALDAGRPAEALRIANEFLRSRPGYGPAAAMKARALVEVGRPREAVALFEEYGTATPSELTPRRDSSSPRRSSGSPTRPAAERRPPRPR